MTPAELFDAVDREQARRHAAELAEIERDHRKRMWRDITRPFFIGMASLTVVVIAVSTPEWAAVSVLALPGVFYCQYKLSPFLI